MTADTNKIHLEQSAYHPPQFKQKVYLTLTTWPKLSFGRIKTP